MCVLCYYPSEIQISLLAMPPEEHGGARVGSGDGLSVDQQPDQDPHHQNPVEHPHQEGGQHPVQPALRLRCEAGRHRRHQVISTFFLTEFLNRHHMLKINVCLVFSLLDPIPDIHSLNLALICPFTVRFKKTKTWFVVNLSNNNNVFI